MGEGEGAIVNGRLTINTTGSVEANNVTFQAGAGVPVFTADGKLNGNSRENVILNVTAKAFTMTNCTVERTEATDGVGLVLSVTLNGGEAILENCNIISPVSDKVLNDQATLEVLNGKLVMTGGKISTNGFGLFEYLVKSAELDGVSFCGLEESYEGISEGNEALFMAINCIVIVDIKLTNCTISETRSYAMLIGGDNYAEGNGAFEATGCTFADKEDGIVIGYTNGATIGSVTLKDNKFALNAGAYPVVFVDGSLAKNPSITVSGNTNGDKEFEVGFLATVTPSLQAALNFLTEDNTEKIEQRIVVGLSGNEFELSEGLTINVPLTLRGVTGNETIKASNLAGSVLTVNAENVTIENIKFEVETLSNEGHFIVNAMGNITMKGCTLKRTTGVATAYGLLLNVVGDATLNDCTFIAPVSGTEGEIDKVSPSVMEVKGQLTMTDGTISTNGSGLFAQHISNAVLTNVTFCGLEGYYEGSDCEVKTLYMAVNSTEVKSLVLDGCIIKNCRSWGVLTGGQNVTIENNTFDNSNTSLGIVFSFGTVTNATIKGNIFSLLEGKDTIRFGQNSVTANTVLDIEGNTVNGGNAAVKFQVATGETDLANVLACLNNEKTTIDATVTVQLYEGEYSPTANEQFKILASNVSLVGADVNEDGSYKTIINAKSFFCSTMAGFIVNGNNCTVKDLKIVTESDNKGIDAMKVTQLVANGDGYVHNFTLTNAEIVGSLGHALNLHGVNNVTVDNVKIGDHGKCGISIAKAMDVLIKNTEFTANGGWNADIGLMFDTEDPSNPAYNTHCEVTVDFGSCEFAKNVIYSERPNSAPDGVDYLYNGSTIEGRIKVNEKNLPEGWNFVATDDGWNMSKQA